MMIEPFVKGACQQLWRGAVILLSFAIIGMGLSVAQASVRIKKFNYVNMSDGVTISATVMLPDGDGPFPPVIISSPYGDSIASPNFAPAPILLKNGYAVIVADWRGTGCSGGQSNVGTHRFGQDGYELVEWAAAQSWSTGRVGMAGPSARGIVQWFVAAQKPPHLKAIAPSTYVVDLYRDGAYRGGVAHYMPAARWSLVDQPKQSARVLVEADATCLANRKEQSGDPVFPGLSMLSFPHPEAFYDARSILPNVSEIDIPTLMFLATYDAYAPANGTEMFDRVKAPKRLLLSNGGHGMSRMPPAEEEIVRWFDRWLKEDKSIKVDKSSVRVFFETNKSGKPGFSREYTSWPPAANELTLYLGEGGKLAKKKHDAVSKAAYRYSSDPAAPMMPAKLATQITSSAWQTMPNAGLHYESQPLAENLELVGNVHMNLSASVSTFDVDLMAILSEEASNGDVTYFNHTLLRASRRPLAANDGKGNKKSVPLVPGKTTNFDLRFSAIGHALRAGSKIRLDLVPAWVLSYHFGLSIVPVPYESTVTVNQGGTSNVSRLRLPVVAYGNDLPSPPLCDSRPAQPCRHKSE